MQGLFGWLRVIRRESERKLESEREDKFEDGDVDSSCLVCMDGFGFVAGVAQMAMPMSLACDGRMEITR